MRNLPETIEKITELADTCETVCSVLQKCDADIDVDISRLIPIAVKVKTPRDFIVLKRAVVSVYECFPFKLKEKFNVVNTQEQITVFSCSSWEIWFCAPITVEYDSMEVLKFFEAVYDTENKELREAI